MTPTGRPDGCGALLAMALAALLGGGPVSAQPLDTPRAPLSATTLIAPEPVRALLAAHFQLPAAPLADETARAAFARRARLEIGELLATEGYFSPTVVLRPNVGADVLEVEVTPGPRTMVAGVDIEFRGDLAADDAEKGARVERLRAAWPLQPGQPFRSPAWEEAKAALLAALAPRDYPGATIVDSRAEVDPETARVRLSLVVDSGPAFRFGDLSISGLVRYDEALVRRQAPFRAGDPYRQDLLLAFQAALQNMPQFGSVVVSVEPDPAQHAAVPVRVQLSEAKSQRLALGVGYSSNNGARGEINYRSHDFLGRAWDLNGGLHLEQNRRTLFADIDILPDEHGYRLSSGARAEATDIQGLATRRQLLGVARSRRLGRIETRLAVDWQREYRRPAGGREETDRALALDWRWTRREVDNPLLPRRGDIIDVRLGGGSRHLLSDQDFVRSQLRYQRWWPVGERDVVSLRGEAGLTAAPSRFGIPQDYLFRAGGPQSVRGYAYQSLGVREGSAVVGGRVMASGSVEYTHWFSADWGGALFVDAGGAADRQRDLRLAAGYGAGARWRSPAGPLGLDLAYGQDDKTWRLHFAITVGF